MNKKLSEKLKTLPRSAGVYFHKSAKGEIIYVGKAAVLKNRVRQYFQNVKDKDVKTQALVAEIAMTEWTETESEIDALFLESEMIKRYKPRYNVLLRDDKSQIFVRINMKDDVPSVTTTRQPSDDDAEYYGPYYNGWAVKKALRLLRKVFPYYTLSKLPKKADLNYHLGLTPGLEADGSLQDYRKNLRKLTRYLSGERKKLIRELETEMKTAAAKNDFETAAKLRNSIRNLGELQRQIVFGRDEFLDMSKDQALVGLRDLLGLSDLPKRIEGYDISHMSGTNNVASMVVATNGLADKAEYRKFKLHIPGNNDFAHMNEALGRRFSGRHDWQLPDLLVIDGGKGQLDAALKILEEKDLKIPTIGLAKREEEIVIHKTRSNIQIATGSPISQESDDFTLILLDKNSHIVKLLQRLRDESHRFAVSYHTHLKRQKQTANMLEEIPGIGPKTRTKLIKKFGSLRGVQAASVQEIASVIGDKKAKLIK
ncbi:MAG: excinuclease ABC subunit UvrC [Candidatus Saccharibacteria bacterium]|nr:excinuclease ABC subunit UvrC [Candidatus Saccharibacteria bacterium]